MYDHVQSLSLSFYDEMEVGPHDQPPDQRRQVVQDLLTTGSLTSLSNFVGLPSSSSCCCSRDWQLALVTFAIVPPLVLVMVSGPCMRARPSCRRASAISALYGNLAESISGVRAIQSMSREGENSQALRPPQRREPQRQQLGGLPQLSGHAGHRDLPSPSRRWRR